MKLKYWYVGTVIWFLVIMLMFLGFLSAGNNDFKTLGIVALILYLPVVVVINWLEEKDEKKGS